MEGTMPITDTAVRNAKTVDKPVKLYDGLGLFVIVTPAGGKWWRFRYRFEGKEKLLSLRHLSRHQPQGCPREARGGAQADCPRH
jgi:hypothetical protein